MNTTKLAPYAGVKKQDENGRTVLSKLWNMGLPRFEGVMEFDGVSESWININNLPIGGSKSISYWIQPFNYNLNEFSVTGGLDSRSLNSVQIRVNSSWNLVPRLYDDTGGTYNFSNSYNTIHLAETWQHHCLIFESNTKTAKLYVNGEEVLSQIFSDYVVGTGFGDYRIGSQLNFETSSMVHANYSHAQIWDRALSQSEIQANMYKTLKGDENGLVAYYPLDEIVDINGTPSVLDKTANANHGTVEGNPSVVSPFNPIFPVGNEPEFHKTREGNEQVCVEKHSVNQKTNGSFQGTLGANSPTGWNFSTQAAEGEGELIPSIFLGRNAMKISIENDGRAYIQQSQTLPTGTYTLSLVVESLVGGTDRFAWIHSEGSNIDLNEFEGFDSAKPFPQFVWKTFSFSEGDNSAFRIGRGASGGADAGEVVFSSVKVEEGSYPTLFHEGTRLAPKPFIQNNTPDYGNIIGRVELVYQPKEESFLLSEFGTHLKIVDVDGTPTIRGQIHGVTFTHPFPEAWSAGTFKRLSYNLSWGNNSYNLELTTDTDTYNLSDTDTPIYPLIGHRGNALGHRYSESGHTSVRYERLQGKPNTEIPTTDNAKLLVDPDGGLDPLVNFSRASGGTRINPQGLIEEVGVNEPRFDYDPVTRQCKGLLIEESRTNILLRSEEFNNTVWSKTSGGTGSAPIVTANAGIAPDKTETADRFQFNLNGGNSSSDLSVIQQAVSMPVDSPNTRSIWLKSYTGENYEFMLGTNVGTVTFQKITVTEKWQRFSVSHTNTSEGTNIYFGLRNVSGVSGLSDSADILIWGAQLEQGSFPTSYIPTAGTTVTRSADICDVTDLSWYNQSEGTFVIDSTTPPTLDNTYYILVDDGTSDSRMLFRTANNNVQFFSVNPDLHSLTLGTEIENQPFKSAFSYSTGNIKGVLNAGVVESRNTSIPTITNFKIATATGTFQSGRIFMKKLLYFPKALTDPQLIKLTS